MYYEQMLHRYEDRGEQPDLEDYDRIMKYYRGKTEYKCVCMGILSLCCCLRGTM